MIFDFDRFTTAVKLAYRHCDGCAYDLEEVLHVFRYYFETYEMILDTAHPMISIAQIAKIIIQMPYVLVEDDDPPNNAPGEEDYGPTMLDLLPEEYEAMIDQHFITKYARCDYNINHFFSGMIRQLRYYETCY